MTIENIQWIVWGFGLFYMIIPALCIGDIRKGLIVGFIFMFFCTLVSLSGMTSILRNLNIGI